MLPAITTTHAIPRQIPSGRAVLRTTVICHYCLNILGSASQPDDRRVLETRHKCGEKVLAEQPAISVPFS
jgi:hypothetical protein